MQHKNIEAALTLLAAAIQGAAASTGHHTGDLVKQVHDTLHPKDEVHTSDDGEEIVP